MLPLRALRQLPLVLRGLRHVPALAATLRQHPDLQRRADELATATELCCRSAPLQDGVHGSGSDAAPIGLRPRGQDAGATAAATGAAAADVAVAGAPPPAPRGPALPWHPDARLCRRLEELGIPIAQTAWAGQLPGPGVSAFAWLAPRCTAPAPPEAGAAAAAAGDGTTVQGRGSEAEPGGGAGAKGRSGDGRRGIAGPRDGTVAARAAPGGNDDVGFALAAPADAVAGGGHSSAGGTGATRCVWQWLAGWGEGHDRGLRRVYVTLACCCLRLTNTPLEGCAGRVRS